MDEHVDATPEEALVSRSARGDEQAFGVLVNRYKGMLYSMACRLMKDRGRAEDAAQESFIKAWAALPGFKGESKFSSWLYRICYNTCISELRKKRPEVELDEAMGVPVKSFSRRVPLMRRTMAILLPTTSPGPATTSRTVLVRLRVVTSNWP